MASDFDAEELAESRRRIRHAQQVHRKLWEWAFIYHHPDREEKLFEGARGLGFGIGQERLPAAFAARGCSILATDGPPELAGHWGRQEYSRDKSQLFYEGIVHPAAFNSLVNLSTCDLNAIPSSLANFDFCWSACALKHLGTLHKGIGFVFDSMKTLKHGGIAVHTTELNLSSDDDTVTEGETVLYRRKDIATLYRVLRDAGHRVRPIPVKVGSAPLDHHMDVPPYTHNPHLKLQLMNYVTTSIRIVVERS